VPNSLFLAATAASLAFSSAAVAQNQPAPSVSKAALIKDLDTRFASADANHDGIISKAELASAQSQALQQLMTVRNQQVKSQFDRMDTNKDGKLSYDEFSAAAPTVKANETPDQLFTELDTNKDGKISAEEFRAPKLAQFNAVDFNKDGTVTVDELRRAAAAAQKK
jgi:Ca2+-binding EF-hand superfamily protein